MDADREILAAWLKVAVAWIGATVGGITLSSVAFILTIVFTALQIYISIRSLRKESRLEKLEAQLRHQEIPRP